MRDDELSRKAELSQPSDGILKILQTRIGKTVCEYTRGIRYVVASLIKLLKFQILKILQMRID